MTDDKTIAFRYNDVQFPVVIGAEEEIISSTIESTGVWEENQLSLYSGLVPPDGVFLDVGANVGINSIFAKMIRPRARVVAVEPEPRNFERLSRNCANLGIELHNMAIADRRGSIGFAGTGTNAHIADDGDHQVPCDTLDNFAAGLGLEKIDLLKIDVEGFTDVVLSEASATLAKTNVAIIEFSHGDIVSRLQTLNRPADEALEHSEELFDQLRADFQYHYYISRNDGLIELQRSADLFEIMFSEATVGDVLASRVPMKSISALSFAFRNILELKRQNHVRLLQIEELQATKSVA